MITSIPLTPAQAVWLSGLVAATDAAKKAHESALQAVALGALTVTEFRACTNLRVESNALLCFRPDPTPSPNDVRSSDAESSNG